MPSIPVNLRDLLESSDFIGNTPDSHKINWKAKSYTFSDSWTGSIFRWLHGESAMYTVHQVQRVSERIIDSVKQYSETDWDSTVVDSSIKLLKGIENLRKTYQANVEVSSALTIVIINIKSCLNEPKESLD